MVIALLFVMPFPNHAVPSITVELMQTQTGEAYKQLICGS